LIKTTVGSTQQSISSSTRTAGYGREQTARFNKPLKRLISLRSRGGGNNSTSGPVLLLTAGAPVYIIVLMCSQDILIYQKDSPPLKRHTTNMCVFIVLRFLCIDTVIFKVYPKGHQLLTPSSVEKIENHRSLFGPGAQTNEFRQLKMTNQLASVLNYGCFFCLRLGRPLPLATLSSTAQESSTRRADLLPRQLDVRYKTSRLWLRTPFIW